MIKATSKVDIENLEVFNENMEGLNKNHAEIGIWGGKTEEGGDLVVMASAHEFGSKKNNIPERSFLRYPIEHHKKKIIKTFTVLADRNKYVKNGWEVVYNGVRATAEDAVMEAFDTGGWGTWAKLKDATIKAKGGSRAILIRSGNLRRKVTTITKENEN